MTETSWTDLHRLLVVRLDNLGDVLLMTPALRAIKTTRPDLHLTLLAGPVGAQVGDLNDDIDDVIVYQSPWTDVWSDLPFDPTREMAIIERLRLGRFDGAIIFTSFRQSPLPAAYLCYLAGIPLRAAASVDGSGSLLTTRHRFPENLLMHEAEKALDLARVLGFRSHSQDLVLRRDESDIEEMRWRLLTGGVDLGCPLAVVHPGCTMPARTYPWELFAEVIEQLQQVGWQVVLTGTTGELGLIDQIQVRLTRPALSLAGQTSFRDLAAVIALADLVITNNTGPQHVAAALKTPVVVLFALTNPPQQWGPWQVPHRQLYAPVPCAICYSRVCPTDHGCLIGVSPEAVVEAALELYAETRSEVTVG